MFELGIQIGIFLFLISLGLLFGRYIERKHFQRLNDHDVKHQGFAITQLKSYPGGTSNEIAPKLFAAEAVISSDYLKSFLSKIRKFFGGELRSYHSLLERARRQAQARIVERAAAEGYDTICNLRFETADIGGVTNPKKAIVMVAVIAYATAYKRPQTN